MTALQNGIELNIPDYSRIACLKATYLNDPTVYLPVYLVSGPAPSRAIAPAPVRTIAPQSALSG